MLAVLRSICKVCCRTAVHAAPYCCHVALLLWFLQEIILKYPNRAEDQYHGEVYTGENALHIAIINGDEEMVRLLCRTRPNVLLHHATGPFFAPSGDCYYGELPLSFAVCTRQEDMVRLLLDMGAALDAVDWAHGNTAIHMAALYGLQDMFDFLRAEWGRRRGAYPHRQGLACLSDLRNKDGHTCLSLAAAEGSVDIFDHVLTSKGKQLWAYGAVTCTLYPVESLDEGTPNALQDILQNGRHEMLVLPRIRRLCDTKWEVFGKKRLFQRLLKHCLVLFILQFALMLPRATMGRAHTDWTMLLRPLCECVVLCNAMCKGVTEVKELARHGIMEYFGQGKAFVFENVCSLLNCMAVCGACACRACNGIEDTGMENIALVLVSFTHWLYLAWFMLGFQLTGPFIISAIEMLATDIPAFLMAVSVFMGAFASGMYILSNKVGLHFWMRDLEVCLMAVLGDPQMEHFEGTLDVWPLVAKVFLILYMITVSLVMLNMLIAKMGSTYDRISQQSELEWLLERGRVLSSIEHEMSAAELAKCRELYWVKDENGTDCFQVKDHDPEHWVRMQEKKKKRAAETGSNKGD